MGVNGIYGLSGSGLDVESMVKVGMLSKQSEYEKMQQKYTKDEWKKTELLGVYSEIQTFNASTLSQYKMSSNMNSRSATSANTSALTATANANAATMTHYVEVNQLASSAYLIGTTSPERLNKDASEKNQLSSVLFNKIETVDEDGKTKYIVNGNADTKYDANAVAFEFSINDGVNGLLSSSNSDAVIASASPDLATGTYKIEVSEVAKASTFGASISATADTNALTAIAEFANSSYDANYIKSYVGSNSSITSPVIEFKVGTEGNLANVKFTYSDFKEFFDSNATVGDILKNINNQIQEQLGTDAAIQATITDGKLSFTDTSGKVGSGSEVILEANYQKAINAITGSNTTATDDNFDPMMARLLVGLIHEANITSITGASATPVSEGTIQLKIPGTDAKIKVTSVDSAGTETPLFNNTSTDGTVTGTYSNTSLFSLNGNDLSLNNGLSVTAKEVATGTSAVTITNDSSTKSGSVVSVTYGELYDGFTFNDLTSKVNSMGLNVRFNYDSVQDRFSLYNKKSGEENQINIQLGSDNAALNAETFFNKLGLQQSSNGAITGEVLKFDLTNGKNSVTQSGVNAMAKVDGIEYNKLDSNNLTVDGVTYNLSNVTSDKVAVTVTQNTDTILKNVESFVSDYNALLTKLYKWYDEKPNADYKPLTETQKSTMKEEQIEKWEEKAKAGMLYHDKTLGNVITELRSAVSENVEGVNGKYTNIFSIGISTTGLKGQLTLDKDKLKAALADDPDAVYNVFAKLDGGEKQYLLEADDGSGKTFWSANRDQDGYHVAKKADGTETTRTIERASYNGIAQRLGDIFMAGMKSIKAVSGSTADVTEDSELNNLMRELQTKMSNFKKMMQAFETQLYKKYDAMESSLALLGSQLNYVTSAFQ